MQSGMPLTVACISTRPNNEVSKVDLWSYVIDDAITSAKRAMEMCPDQILEVPLGEVCRVKVTIEFELDPDDVPPITGTLVPFPESPKS